MARSGGEGAARVAAGLEATGMSLTQAQAGFLNRLIAENDNPVSREGVARDVSAAQQAGTRLTTRRLRTIIENNAG